MIEILLVVGLISMFTTIIFVSYNHMLQKTKRENAEKYIVIMDAGIQSTWGVFLNSTDVGLVNGLNGAPIGASTINNQNVIGYNIVPAPWIGVGVNIVNEWGGNVVAGFRLAIAAGQPNLYSINMQGVPAAACSYLASNMGGRFYEITVNGTNLKNSLDIVANAGNQIDAANVTTACNFAENNTVIFYNRFYPKNYKVYGDSLNCSLNGTTCS